MLQQQIEGKYELLGQLEDEGGAEVYKVRHLFLEEVRLIKVVHPPSLAMTEEVTERFLREARTAIKLRHPNIAQLHDFTIDEEGTAFIVTELIEGLTLEEALAQEGPPPLELTLNIARQALRALGYLHRAGMVHRDISPDKLMLTRDVDGRALIKWVDLGTAQILAVSDGLPAGTGVFPARPKYASPEQFNAADEGAVDARSDLYSFGVVIYELLTGRCPIAGRDPFSLMVGHLSTPPLPFAESDPQGRIPAEVREILLSTLAKRLEERVASADELARRLAMLQDPLADDRGEYLEQVLQRARQKKAVVVPVPTPRVAAPKQAPAPAPIPVPAPAPIAPPIAAPVPTPAAPPAAAPRLVDPPIPSPVTAPMPPRSAEPGESVLRHAPIVTKGPGPDWDRQDLPYATQALRIDPTLPSEATRRTLLEPLEPASPPPPAVVAEPGRPRSKPMLIALGAVLLAGVLIGMGWWLGGSRQPAAAPAVSPPAPVVASTPAPAPLPTIEVKEKKAAPPPPDSKPERPQPTPEMAVSAFGTRRDGRKIPQQIPTYPGEATSMPAVQSPPGRGGLITGGPGVEVAEVTSLGRLIYPERARGTGKKPSIKVAVLVDENGNVLQVRLREGDPSKLGFNEAALDAAKRTRFLPGTKDGVPGKIWADLNFDFADPGAPPPGAPPPVAAPPVSAPVATPSVAPQPVAPQPVTPPPASTPAVPPP